MRTDMTDAQRLMNNAASKGREVDEGYAEVLALAKSRLAADPNNEMARQILENFSRFMDTGERVTSFAEFMI
jgi:hypothetical protein